MADGFSRVSQRHGVCIAQNGPGISNFVTGIAAAYWAHSPVVCITPEAGKCPTNPTATSPTATNSNTDLPTPSVGSLPVCIHPLLTGIGDLLGYAGTVTKGFGGFQETDQLPMFEAITKYQAHINHPSRMAEMTGRAFDEAMHDRGPVQINIPRELRWPSREIEM